VKEATVAARVVAAKDASSFDHEMSKLNAALFPSEKKAAWHQQSPEDISKHWKEVSANAMGKGGDELSRKAAFAASPKAHPAAGKAAVKREAAVEQHEQLSAVEQAAAEIEHIKAITEAAFPTMMNAVKNNQKDKISAAQLLAVHKEETNSVFPKRFATQEAKGKTLMAKKLAKVEKAQAELFGRLHGKHESQSTAHGMMKQADAIAMAQHEQIAKQKHMAQLHGYGEVKMHHTGHHAHTMASGPHPKAMGHHKSAGFGRGSDQVTDQGTNIVFQGTSQGGDKYFHNQPAKESKKSTEQEKHH